VVIVLFESEFGKNNWLVKGVIIYIEPNITAHLVNATQLFAFNRNVRIDHGWFFSGSTSMSLAAPTPMLGVGK
jgi:hypothetical protein